MRLATERDLRAEQVDLALAVVRLDDGHTALEIVLTPGPTAAQRLLRVEPRNRLRSLRGRVGIETEHRAVVEEDVHLLVHAGSNRLRVVDRNPKDRTRDVVLLALQLTVRLTRRANEQVIVDRQIERVAE